jgi:hypothetical protein
MPTHILTRRPEPQGTSTLKPTPSTSPCVQRGYREVDASRCHDAKRAQSLSDAQASPNAVYEVLFSRASLLALFALSCTDHGRAMRTALVGRSDRLLRIDAEAMRALEDAGLAEPHGKMVHITEAGEKLVRELVMLARADLGGNGIPPSGKKGGPRHE